VITVVLNPRSGAARAGDIGRQIAERFAARNREVRFLDAARPPELRASLAHDVGEGRVVVAAGGDGTVSAVAAVVAGTPAQFAVLPIGTLNHFAKDAGIPLDLDRAIETVVGGKEAALDVASMNEETFVNNCSIGVYPSVVQARDALRDRGYRKWTAFMRAMIAVVGRQHRLSIRVEADGEPSHWRTPFVLVGNNAYDMTGLRVGGRSTMAGGRLAAYLAPRVRARDLPLAVAREVLGRALLFRPAPSAAFHVIDACEMSLAVGRLTQLDVALDGEIVTATLPLRFRIRPRALRVLVPRD
jgi:diacylglycerol kinase family enzyme